MPPSKRIMKTKSQEEHFMQIDARIQTLECRECKPSELSTWNRVRTSFSPSPINLEVNDDALMLKKVQLASEATAFARRVFPFPGGPNRSKPRAGERKPLNKSGLVEGRMSIS